MKTWQGRLSTPSSSLFDSFTSSIVQDRVLAPYDVAVSQAHARALARAGLISGEEAAQLVAALSDIGDEIGSGQMEWRDDLEDVHTHIEVQLREKLGDLAGKLHTGRSRNDQVAADLRLYVRDHERRLLHMLLDLEGALIELASRYSDALMPGYTHLQQAQPVLIAYPLLAHAAMLTRDWERFREAMARTTHSPLGSGALAGSSFPIDRRHLAEAVGLGAPIENSLDAVSDRDFAVEFVFAAALCMTHLSRLAEDVIIWSSVEFGFVKLPDGFASGSSMMPQKKNPDVLELIRGKSALVIGDVTALLVLVKGLPLGYNRDIQEDKTPLFHSTETLEGSIAILSAMVPEMAFDVDRCAASISSFAMATDLAEHLVRQGVPFREAHARVGSLVSRALDQGSGLTDIVAAEPAGEAGPRLDPTMLTPEASVRGKATEGSTNPEDVRRQIERAGARIAARRHWLERSS
ncbi:MAG TPA: argininosuccinate lyase [Chloroflexota bacterium]|nr:argininosuccinate lyase [Chloroflexota bacterium]